MNIFLKDVFYFFLYSAIGWFVESLYCSIGEKKWINRGFLKGPICPIYGTGAVVMIVLLMPLSHRFEQWYYNTLLIFGVGMVLCDIVEFITSFLMEKLFHARWWDYSKKKFNIQGRICLTHTLYWGLASVVFVQLGHPFLSKLLDSFITPGLRNNMLLVILTLFAIDLFNTVRSALRFRSFSIKLQRFSDMMSQAAELFFSTVGSKVDALQTKSAMARKELSDEVHEQYASLKAQFFKLREPEKSKVKKSVPNLLHSFPYLEKGVSDQMERLENMLNEIDAAPQKNENSAQKETPVTEKSKEN